MSPGSSSQALQADGLADGIARLRRAFGYHAGTLEAAVSGASDARRLVVLVAAGAFGGPAWYLLRRLTPGERTEIDDVVWGRGSGCRSGGRWAPR